jgi:tRNA dimethylallyltransferase
MSSQMILLLGTTASGKAKIALELAKKIDAEIISVDSMKVYRRMDIGTAKPSKKIREQVRHYLIDVVEPSESFSVGRFLDLSYEAIEQIKGHSKNIIAVGGTALYIKALLYGLFEGPGADEQIRKKLQEQVLVKGVEKLYQELSKIDPPACRLIHPNDAKRIIRALEVYELTGKPISGFQTQWNHRSSHPWIVLGLRRNKQEDSKRINARVKKMIDAGLVDEVKKLLAEDKPLSKQASCAIGYAEIIDYLNGKTSLDEAIELIKQNTRRFAKHQRTWFKTFRNVNWLDLAADEMAEQILPRVIELLKL